MPVHRCCKRCKKYLENILKKVVDKKEVFVYNNSCVTERNKKLLRLTKFFNLSGCGSAWLERLVWDQEVAGSNPVTPTCMKNDFCTTCAGVVQW